MDQLERLHRVAQVEVDALRGGASPDLVQVIARVLVELCGDGMDRDAIPLADSAQVSSLGIARPDASRSPRQRLQPHRPGPARPARERGPVEPDVSSQLHPSSPTPLAESRSAAVPLASPPRPAPPRGLSPKPGTSRSDRADRLPGSPAPPTTSGVGVSVFDTQERSLRTRCVRC